MRFASRIWRPVFLTCLCAVPTLALANASMGLGLERWDLASWAMYCLAMWVGEAWLIGRWMKMSWLESLGRSLGANFITAGCCGGFGLMAPFLHQPMIGPRMNPNPVLESVVMMVGFAIPSAIIESMFWRQSGRKSTLRTLLVHLMLVPVGLIIILIPERPHRGLQSFVNSSRRFAHYRLQSELTDFLGVQQRYPKATTIPELLVELESDIPLIAFEPVQYGRFSNLAAGKYTHKINSKLAGKSVEAVQKSFGDEPVEYLMLAYPGPYGRKLIVYGSEAKWDAGGRDSLK